MLVNDGGGGGSPILTRNEDDGLGPEPTLWQKVLRLPREKRRNYATAFEDPTYKPAESGLTHQANSFRLRQIAEEYENAYMENAGRVPVTWLAQISPDDLGFLTNPDTAHKVNPTLIEHLQQVAINREMQKDLERKATERYQTEKMISDFYQNSQKGWNPAPTPGGVGEAPGLQPERMVPGEKYSKEAWDETLEQYFADINGDYVPWVEKGFKAMGSLIAVGGMIVTSPFTLPHDYAKMLLTGNFEIPKTFQHILAELTGYDRDMDGNLRPRVASDATTNQREMVRLQQTGELREDHKQMLYQGVFLPHMVNDIRNELPDLWGEYMDMYGDEETARLGLMLEAQDMRSELVPEDQLEGWVNNMYEENEQLLQEMELADFQTGHAVVRTLATYGQWTMGTAAGLTAFLSDEEAQDLMKDMEFEEAFDRIAQVAEEGGNTPSGVLGLEGTLVGIGADFGFGMVVDPLNWFFGAKGALGINGLATRASVLSRLGTPAMRMYIRNFARDFNTANRSAMGQASLAIPYMEVGKGAALLNVTGRSAPIIPYGLWRRTPLGRKSQVVPTSTVLSWSDDIAMAKPGLQQLDDAARQLQSEGFDSPLKAVYSPEEGRLVFHDPNDVARALAAESLGVDAVPVTIRVVNETTDKPFFNVNPTNMPLRKKYLAELEADESVLLDKGLQEWMGNSRAMQARINDVMNREGGMDIHTLSRAEDLDVMEAVVDSMNTHNQARAIVRWYNRKSEPTPGLHRGVSGEKNVAELFPDGPPKPGDEVTIGINSATDSVRDAAMFAGDDGWILEFPEITPAVRVPSGQKLWFVSGRYVVKEVDEAIQTVVLEYVERTLPDIPDSTGLPHGVPRGVDIDQPPRHLPIERVEKADYARPSDLLGETVLPRTNNKAMKDLIEETLMLGGDVPAARQTWAAIGLGRYFRSLMKHDPFNMTGLNRYFRTTFNRNRIGIAGVGGRARLLEQLEFLAADYPEFLNHWINRILENEELGQRTSYTKAGAMQEVTRLREIEIGLNESGGVMQSINDLANEFPELTTLANEAKGTAALKAMIQTQIRERLDDIRTARALDESAAQPWSEVVREMLDDYNKQFIATNPQWAGFVDENGMVPWNAIHRGPAGTSNQVQGVVLSASQEVTEKSAVAKVADDFGVKTGEMETMLNQVMSYTNHGESAVVLPATPVELLAATELGGSKFTKWTQNHWLNGARQTLFFLDQIWKANVLLTPRTFFVMSFDELLSMFHTYGHSAVVDYMKTRSARWYSRVQALLHGKPPTVKRGEPYLGTRTGDLLRNNLDTPAHMREYQRALSEATSQEKQVLEPGALGYDKAAQDWAALELENPGFRAFLAGPTSFKSWFEKTEDGMAYQYRVTVYDRSKEGEVFTRPIKDSTEGYQLFANGWQRILEKAREAGLKPKQESAFLEAWRDTAEQINSDPTHRVRSVPDWTWKFFGPLEGTMPLYPGRGLSWELISRVYQGGAANPSFFRQGIIMNTARESELARLETLRRSHPTHRQLSDSEGSLSTAQLIEIVRGNGWPMTILDPQYRPLLDQLLADQGFLTDSWIGNLAERRAEQAVDDLTYSFEEGSRAGLLARPVWPFGRAWAEMYGRWGRGLMSHMAVRNIWQKVPGVGKLLRGVANLSPINLRTAGFLSRFAALSLDVTEGVAGEGGGVIPGTTETDFTPLTFLPTVNGGPATLMPGFGPVGLPVLSAWMETKFDPVEDPQGYQEMQDFISQVIPGARFAGQSILTQTLGGGNLGLLMSTLGDIQTGIFHRSFREGSYLGGDLGREIERNRQVSAILSDPDVMADILAEGDPEMVRAILMGVNNEADTASSLGHFLETATKWFVPSRTQADSALDEIYSTWIAAGREFESLNTDNLDQYTDADFRKDGDLLRETGDRIRRNFFQLPPWERDALIAVMPTLATNMITGWQWRRNLPANIPNQDRPYAIASGAPDELDRHNLYANRGYIVPKDSMLRGFHIVGRAVDARFNTAQNLYEFQAEFLNNFRWDNGLISEETHALLDFLVTTPEMKKLGMTDPKTLWKKWGDLGEAVVATWAKELGYEPDSDEYEDFAANFKIPDTKDQPDEAWGETWRGDMSDTYSQRFRDLELFEFDERTERLAEMVGIDLRPGMTGEEFINDVLAYKKGNESAAWNAVRYEYDGYISERGRDVAAALATLDDLAQHPSTPPAFSDNIKEFVTWADVQGDRSYNEGSLPRLIQEEAVDRWMRLSTGYRDAPVAWDKVWRDAFQPMFGPLDWEPPEPPVLIDPETGQRNKNAWMPVVVSVEDGDTINVSQYTGPALSGEPHRLLEREGTPRYHSVRILGVMAADYGLDEAGAESDKRRLEDRLLQAYENGDTIWLIRDPAYTGSPVDGFGRELAWLQIGDEMYWFPEDMTRTDS